MIMTFSSKRFLLTLFIVLVHCSRSQSTAGECPNDLPFTTSMKVFHDSCYQFVSKEMYWDEARDFCLRYGGRLAKVDDPDTNRFVIASLNSLWWRNSGIWIGLHDTKSELQWHWTGYKDGEDDPVLWTNWGRGHPGAFLHNRRDCVRMVRGDGADWRWHETFCHSLRWHYRFICEYRKTSATDDDATAAASAAVAAAAAAADGSIFNNKVASTRNVPPTSSEYGGGLGMIINVETANGEISDNHEIGLNAAVQQIDKEEEKNGNYGGIFLSFGIGCLLLISLIIVTIFLLRRRRQKLRQVDEQFYDSSSKVSSVRKNENEEPTKKKNRVCNIYVNHETLHRSNLLPSSESPVSIDSPSGEYLLQIAKSSLPSMEYDTPKPRNIYSEISDEEEEVDNEYQMPNFHIYEALEDLKK